MHDIYDAIKMALEAHDNQFRKLDGDIYAAHPIEVALLLASAGASEDVQIAGILHDTLEDTELTVEEIRTHFGNRVSDLVVACSEPDKDLPWKSRKENALAFMRSCGDPAVKLILLADKLSNIKSIHRNLSIMEGALWDNFNAGFEEQKWYFRESLDALESLSDTDMYKRFAVYVHQVFDRR